MHCIAIQPDGKILVGGVFVNVGGQARNHIARLDATTGLADTLNPNANDFVETIAVQSDGKIVAGGYFTAIGGQTRNRLARLDASTGLADTLNPNAPNAGDVVYSVMVQSDGKILAGGIFTTIGGQTRNNIARLDGSTGLADTFNPNGNDSVLNIAVQSDGKVVAGGSFTTIGGQTRNRIARLDGTTGAADTWNPNATGSVNSIAIQSNGKVVAGGDFSGATSIGGQTRNFIARIDGSTVWLIFRPKRG